MANEPEGHKRRLINITITIIVRQVKEEVKEAERGAGGRKEQN